MIKEIEFKFNRAIENAKIYIQEKGLLDKFQKLNQDVQNIFKEYSSGFEDDIKYKAKLRKEIRWYNRVHKELEFEIKKLKN